METHATARLRALGQSIRVYVLEPGYRYCIPSASGDGSAYQVLDTGGTATCSCPAGMNNRYCKQVAAVRMRKEAEALLTGATAVDALERKVAELYR